MSRTEKANRAFALKANWALECTIDGMQSQGYIDDDFNAINGHSQSFVDNLFKQRLEVYTNYRRINAYDPTNKSFEGLLKARKQGK